MADSGNPRRSHEDQGSLNQITDAELSGPVIDRRTTVKLLGAVGMGSIAGCGGGGGGDGGGQSGDQTETTTQADSTTTSGGGIETGGTLNAGWFIGSIDTLDPAFITVPEYFELTGNIYSGLVALDDDLTVRGDLATDWTVSNGGERIEFDLREGVMFHNGTEFTAEDVRYTINRTLTQDTDAASKLEPLQPVDDGGVEIIDDYTVALNFKRPYAPIMIFLTRGPGRAVTIVNQEALEEMGREQYGVTPVGTGAFEVTEHNVGSGLTLEAFDDYFETDSEGNSLPYLDTIEIQPLPDPASVVNALRSGDIDFANNIPLQNVSEVESASEVNVLSGPGINWEGFFFHHQREPFTDHRVRQGIAKLLDSEAYVQSAYFGNAVPDVGPINKATEWVWRDDKPDDQDYDPEAGQQLLEEAGVIGESFSILAFQGNLRPAQVVRQQLSDYFDIEIDQVTNSVYFERLPAGDFDTTVIGSSGDPDPDQSLYFSFLTREKGGVLNPGRYSNEEVDQLLMEQRRQLDREERKQTLWEIEDMVISDVADAFLCHVDDVLAHRNNVRGFTHLPAVRNFHQTWISS